MHLGKLKGSDWKEKEREEKTRWWVESNNQLITQRLKRAKGERMDVVGLETTTVS